MNQITKALVIREQTIGEGDRLVTLLSGEYGLMRAFVRGAKLMKSKKASSTSLFSYAKFSLYRGKDAYVVDFAEPIEVFFDLRFDIERLALAQYFAQLAYDMCAEEVPAPKALSLILNSIHLLCKSEKDVRIIKSVFEFRLMSISGYMPDIIACKACGTYETDLMYFDIREGTIYCQDCGSATGIPVPKNVITSIRYICLSDSKKIFSFTLNDESLSILGEVSEKFVLERVGIKLPTLEFYKSLANT